MNFSIKDTIKIVFFYITKKLLVFINQYRRKLKPTQITTHVILYHKHDNYISNIYNYICKHKLNRDYII